MRASFGLDAGTDDDGGNDNDEQVFVFICHYPYHMDPRLGDRNGHFGIQQLFLLDGTVLPRITGF